MKRMDEWVKTLLDPSDQEAIEEVSRCGGSKNGMSPGVKTLVGDSLSFVAEKAAAQNIRWQSELVPVYDYEKKEPTFVMKQYANNDRYRRESDIF